MARAVVGMFFVRSSHASSNCSNTFTQLRQVVNNHLPNRLHLHPEVVMDQHVAHAGDLRPRHVGIDRTNLVGQAFDRLADDFEMAEDGILNDRSWQPIEEERAATARL